MADRCLPNRRDYSMARDANEARLCVAEEMAREALNDLEDHLKPAVDVLQVRGSATCDLGRIILSCTLSIKACGR